MAKETRKIFNAVRIGGTVYFEGMEDELQAALSNKSIRRLTAKGQIEGFELNEEQEKKGDAFELPTEAQLGKMSKADLVVVADKAGARVTPDSMTNKQIIEAILAPK